MQRVPEVTTTKSTLGTRLTRHSATPAPEEFSRRGAAGDRVEKLQAALAELNLDPGQRNGKFGAKTEAALKAFQEANGIRPSGIYGPKTRAALRKALLKDHASGGPRLVSGDRGEAVRRLDRVLQKAGVLKGKVNDRFDAQTLRAVKAFERQQGGTVDGIVGEALWRKLGGAGEGCGPRLSNGSSGPAVVSLQRALKARGVYRGAVNGDFGAATERAVKAFERRKGLEGDGVVTNEVWAQLRSHAVVRPTVGGPTLKKGLTGQAVALLQSRLKERGLYSGAIDGRFGEATKQAVKKLERRRGAKTDGVVGNALWTALGGAGTGSGPRLRRGSKGETVEILQRRLKAMGLYGGPVDGDFGPMTQAALKRLEKKRGLTADGIADRKVWGALGRHLVMAPAPINRNTEPRHDYRHVQFRGGEMNARTKVMLERAEAIAKSMGVSVPVFVVQGSYNHGVDASGGTHDGGGALDLRTQGRSVAEVQKLVKAMRMAGFAAWKRGFGGDSFTPHIHAIAIGDRQLSWAARNQVAEYFRGGDGLIGSAPDGDRNVGRPFPKWARKYR